MKKYSELTVITKAKELEDCRIYRLMLWKPTSDSFETDIERETG